MISNEGINHHSGSQPMSMALWCLIISEYLRFFSPLMKLAKHWQGTSGDWSSKSLFASNWLNLLVLCFCKMGRLDRWGWRSLKQIIMIQCVKQLMEGHLGCYASPRKSITVGFTEEKGFRESFLEEVVPDWVLKDGKEFMLLENELMNKAEGILFKPLFYVAD